MSDSLIQKIENAKLNPPTYARGTGFFVGLDAAMRIVREHESQINTSANKMPAIVDVAHIKEVQIPLAIDLVLKLYPLPKNEENEEADCLYSALNDAIRAIDWLTYSANYEASEKREWQDRAWKYVVKPTKASVTPYMIARATGKIEFPMGDASTRKDEECLNAPATSSTQTLIEKIRSYLWNRFGTWENVKMPDDAIGEYGSHFNISGAPEAIMALVTESQSSDFIGKYTLKFSDGSYTVYDCDGGVFCKIDWASADRAQAVLDALNATMREIGKVDIQAGATAILWAMKNGKSTDGLACDNSNYFMPKAFIRFAKACADAWGLKTEIEVREGKENDK